MDHRRERLLELVEQDQPTTVRHTYYRAVVEGLVDKTHGGYMKVQRALVALRRDGSMPYAWIVDNTRLVMQRPSYAGADEWLDDVAGLYRQSLWDNTDERVEVWVESDSIASVLSPIARRWDVPLYPTRGHTSDSFVWSAVEEANAIGRPVVAYYIGDHDPHGLEIEAALREKLYQHAQVPIALVRLGVTWEQVEACDLPGTKPKKNYPYPLAVEAEAMPAPILRELLDAQLESHVDDEQLAQLRTIEATEQLLIKRLKDWDVIGQLREHLSEEVAS